MKKKILLSAFTLVLLAGCGEANADVSNGSKTLIKVGDEEITKSDVYYGLSSQGNVTPITEEMNNIIANKAVKTTKAIKEEAKAQLATDKESYGDDFLNTIKEKGFKDEDDYYKNGVLPTIKSNYLVETYINEKFDELSEEYNIVKAEVILIKEAKDVKAVKKAANKKKADFTAIAAQYGDLTAFSGVEQIYSTESGLPSDLWDAIKDVKTNNETTGVIKDSITNYYYIARVTNTNPSKFKKDAKAVLNSIASSQDSSTNSDYATDTTQSSDQISTLADKAFNYYLNKFDYSIHDVNIYQTLLTSSAKYKED